MDEKQEKSTGFENIFLPLERCRKIAGFPRTGMGGSSRLNDFRT
jgi:hypothetical protein